MRRGWEAEARNWAEFTRKPGRDVAHEDINLPALLRLPPEPAGLTLDSRALESAGLLIEAIREPRASDGRWQRIPLSLQLRAVKP
jgi:hypothetical protein